MRVFDPSVMLKMKHWPGFMVTDSCVRVSDWLIVFSEILHNAFMSKKEAEEQDSFDGSSVSCSTVSILQMTG